MCEHETLELVFRNKDISNYECKVCEEEFELKAE